MKEFDLIIKNGTVVTSTESFLCDVAVKDGKIAAMAQNIEADAKEIYDAAGKLVLPGALDAHTHMAMPFGGTVSADSYMAGTRAAACGGVTTIFDYPVQHKGETIRGLVNSKKEVLEKEACVDYAMHCCITDLNEGEILEEMEKAVAEGITSFKCFLVYKKEGMMVDDGMLARLMLRAKELGAMINIHAENPDLIDYYTEKFLSEGKTSAWYHYMSRPEFVEGEADERAINLAKAANAPLYIVHLANKQGVEAVTKAKDEGYEIYAETCPQYLEFTSDVYKRADGRNFVCSPPMKGQESQDAIWEAIKRGDIDTIATDHCPFQQSEKDWGLNDFRKIPNGCAGIENMYPYMLGKANDGVISFEKAVELCSANPAKIFGCTGKGEIAPGKDADIVIYDPAKEFTIHQENMHSDCDHTIWEGVKVHGYPVQTYSRGRLVFDNGEFVGERGWGRFVKCAKHKAK